jgi:hypothetical protein
MQPLPQAHLTPSGQERFRREIERRLPGQVARVVTEDTILDASDMTVGVDATAGPVTITLPMAGRIQAGRRDIKKIDASGNAVIIAASGGETIDGVATASITTAWHCFTAVPGVDGWWIV